MKQPKTDDLFNFFSSLSKLIIFVPLVIIIIALIFKFNQPKNQTSLNVLPVLPNVTIAPTSHQLKINLTGPYHCIYQDKTRSIEVYIKNKNILGLLKENKVEKKYLLSGDCLYHYDNRVLLEKKCGLSTYITLGESLLNNGLIDLSTLTSQFPGLTGIDVNQVIKSCKKSDIKDQLFKVNN